MSKSWTTSSVVINAIAKPVGLLSHKHAAFWLLSKSSTILSFGGEPYAKESPSAWTLTPDANGSGTWSQVYSQTDSLWQSLAWPRFASNAASPTTGYVLGGMVRDATYGVDFAVPGLTTLDFEINKWSNITTVGKYSTTGLVLYGAAQFVPAFRKAGLLIFLGGSAPITPSDLKAALRPMSSITIYDPESGEWYSQTATGDVPSSRQDMCIAGAQSTNSTTYEM